MTDVLDTLAVDRIARVCHEANRALCYSQGDSSQLPWGQSPEWQRISATKGVIGILDGSITSPEASHESWMRDKLADGWQYGAVQNEARRLHPALLPYDELPVNQKKKDALFFAIVNALK